MIQSCIYEGTVVHKRLRPQPHSLRYRVFSLLLDVDKIDALAGGLVVFSRNKLNLLSFYDRDHGDKTGTSVAEYARTTLTDAGLGHAGVQIMLLSYPRVLGYGFNPISVYYCYDAAQLLAAVIYEVNNTFGERRSYVVPIAPSPDTVHAHACRKELYVSPFTDMTGWYQFRLREPADAIAVGVALRDEAGPLLRTHFTGIARPLSDTQLARLSLLLPLLSLKVVAAIHWEALVLWWKGVPFTLKPRAPRYAVTHVALDPPARSPRRQRF
jgi:uncharacterized protein